MTDNNLRYLPVMILRLMLLLKEVADLQRGGWWSTEGLLVNDNNPQSMKFYNYPHGTSRREGDIALETYTAS